MNDELSALDQLHFKNVAYDLLKGWGFSVDDMGDVAVPGPEEPARKGKKRGAPRGNQNARKNGLYSRLAPAPRPGDVNKALAMPDLTDDIAVVRLMLAHLMQDSEKNMKYIIQLYRVLTLLYRANAARAAGEAEAQAILERWR
ncbi:MAG: hypothetical protein OXC99_04820 [Chloroflexi bacterium]|nr:hypothetical protein [Chloroflexota bacterium]